MAHPYYKDSHPERYPKIVGFIQLPKPDPLICDHCKREVGQTTSTLGGKLCNSCLHDDLYGGYGDESC